MPVDRSKAAEVRKWIEEGKDGTRIINRAQEMTEGALYIPFRSPTLTWASGGGMRIGHWARWYGPEGSGKSLTNWGLAYNAQNYPSVMEDYLSREIRFWQAKKKKIMAIKLKKRLKLAQERFPDGMNVMVFDTEQRADEAFIARQGVSVDEDDLLIVDQNIIEEIIKKIKGSLDGYHIFMIDSVSNCQSYAEANLDPGDYERGTAAAAWKRLRQVRTKWDRRENTLIFVDQMRMQLGAQRPSAKPSQIRFIKHNISLDVEFDRGTRLYLNKDGRLTDKKENASKDYMSMSGDNAQIAGLQMKAFVEKNSTGKPYRESVMRFMFDVADPRTGEMVQEVGFDAGFELLKIAEYYHIVESAGSGNWYLTDENFKQSTHLGRGEWRVIEALSSDPTLIETVLGRIQIDT